MRKLFFIPFLLALATDCTNATKFPGFKRLHTPGINKSSFEYEPSSYQWFEDLESKQKDQINTFYHNILKEKAEKEKDRVVAFIAHVALASVHLWFDNQISPILSSQEKNQLNDNYFNYESQAQNIEAVIEKAWDDLDNEKKYITNFVTLADRYRPVVTAYYDHNRLIISHFQRLFLREDVRSEKTQSDIMGLIALAQENIAKKSQISDLERLIALNPGYNKRFLSSVHIDEKREMHCKLLNYIMENIMFKFWDLILLEGVEKGRITSDTTLEVFGDWTDRLNEMVQKEKINGELFTALFRVRDLEDGFCDDLKEWNNGSVDFNLGKLEIALNRIENYYEDIRSQEAKAQALKAQQNEQTRDDQDKGPKKPKPSLKD